METPGTSLPRGSFPQDFPALGVTGVGGIQGKCFQEGWISAMTDAKGGWSLPSFWMSELAPLTRRPRLENSGSVDVAIVGGGFSGLWTALYLHELDPSLRIAVLEKEVAGYGASGRNGGWVCPFFPVGWGIVESIFGAETTRRFCEELVGTVDEVGARVAELGIDCDYTKAGSISFMRNQAQVGHAEGDVKEIQRRGLAGDWRLLGAREAEAMLSVTYAHGATFTPECATVHPARLVRGLAEAVESRGVEIYEDSQVSEVEDGYVRVGSARLAASKIVVATEAYTAGFDRWRRQVLPLYSMMIITEPLSDAQYEAIGSPTPGLCFADHRHLVIYGQITRDHRIAFGGRGAPYHLGSRVSRIHDTHGPSRDGLQRELLKLFPALRGIRIVRHWGGPLGVSRDWLPRVAQEPNTQLWRIGGYAGDGVATTNLVGRVTARRLLGLADDSASAAVFARPPRDWEPEPFRWLGVNLGLNLTRVVDRLEDRGAPVAALDRLRRTLIGQA